MAFSQTRDFRQGTRDVARTLVIGSSGFDLDEERLSIDSYSWPDIGGIASITDYDVVFVNLRTIEDPATIDWQTFYRLFSDDSARKLLAPGGEVHLLGDPRFEVDLQDHRTRGRLPFLYWTGVEFTWHEASGDSVRLHDNSGLQHLNPYCQAITTWTYSLEDAKPLQLIAGFSHVLVRDKPWKIGRYVACSNRFDNSIVFALGYHEELEPGVASLRGRIVFVPALDLSPEENLRYLLELTFDIELVTPEPEWLAKLVAPGQASIDTEIERIDKETERLEHERAAAEQRREKAREILKLIYTHGNELEGAVHNVLRELGATVTPPVEANKEDGWICVSVRGKEYRGVLEVKGTRNPQIGEQGLRQLAEWVARGIQKENIVFKGINVVSNQIELPPETREPAFSDSYAKHAALQHAVGITALDLYRAYELDKAGQLDRERFWEALFTTDGVFDLSAATRP